MIRSHDSSKVHYSHERILQANDITDLHMLFLNEDRITGWSVS